MTEVRFVDTTLRDGQQSLWAYNMRTGMMVPIVELMDQAGFEAIELGGPGGVAEVHQGAARGSLGALSSGHPEIQEDAVAIDPRHP